MKTGFKYFTFSYNFLLTVTIMGLIGYKIDKIFNISPFVFIIFLLLGIFCVFYRFYKVVSKDWIKEIKNNGPS